MFPESGGAKQDVQSFKAYFAEDGIHHDEETDGNGEGDADELAALEGWRRGRDELAQDNADGHGKDDPDDEEAVEEGEAAKGRYVGGDGVVILEMLEL